MGEKNQAAPEARTTTIRPMMMLQLEGARSKLSYDLSWRYSTSARGLTRLPWWQMCLERIVRQNTAMYAMLGGLLAIRSFDDVVTEPEL